MSDDEQEGRPRRATVKVKRRSLRVPVDEVPRRSSPSLPRVSSPGPAPAAAAPLPPLEPMRTDPGVNVAELSESDIEVDESREMDAMAPIAPVLSEREELLVSSEIEALSSPMITADDSESSEPSLAELGLDASAIERANAPDEAEELSPEATVVTESLEDQERTVSAPPRAKSERPPPATRLSDRPPPAPKSEPVPPPSPAPAPAALPSVMVEERRSTPPTSGAVVVVTRMAMVGTPTPSQPLRLSVELAKAVAAEASKEEAPKDAASLDEASKDEPIELDVDEGRTSAPPEEVVPDELGADELLEEAPSARPSRPPPPRSVPSMPAVSGEPRPAPPPPIPSGPPPAPASASAPAVSAPPPARPPREVAPVAVAVAPAAMTEGPPTDPRRGKKKGSWWEDFFNDDYLRTVPSPNPKQVRRQCDFIESRLGLTAGATVLDVGCGLGLHAVELTRRGYIIVGLDLSLPMLSRAADEAQDQGFKINFLHADMREMSFESAFDAVLSWGTTFGYFEDEANKTVLDRMHRALKPGGLLLLDVVNRDYVIRSQPNNVWFEGDGCVVMEETQCNYITSRLHVKRTVMLDDGRQRESAYSVRLYSLHELGQMLHQKFRVVEVSGRESTPGVYFGADSPRTIVVAERRLPAAPPGPPGPPPKRDADQTPPPAPPPTSDHS
jgi:SAM-dependent methyltransferase